VRSLILKIAIVIGTRPEIIKMSPIIRELVSQQKDYLIIHSGQHYSYNLDRVFFEQLRLPDPKYNLEVGSGTHAQQTAKILMGVEDILEKEYPDVILVEGDTNTVLASALAATKLHIKVGHVEAGLRSHDRKMPEEINRILTDHCSDFLFAPTENARSTLLHEGIPEEKIFVTGNTIVDAVRQNLEIANQYPGLAVSDDIKPKGYFLVTLHRQENVDDSERFASILEGISQAARGFNIPVIYPIHPRSKKNMAKFGLSTDNISLIEPVDFLEFLRLESGARLVLTDSGGVQEETCILGVPCVTLRDSTERPETVTVGSNVVAGVVPDSIVSCTRKMMCQQNGWENPFGDGKAGGRIVSILEGKL